MPTRRTLTAERDGARRTRDQMTEQRDQAQRDLATERFNVRTLARQLSEARDDLDRLRKDKGAPEVPESWQAERSRLRRELMLSERARASLDAQLVVVQAANDTLCRDAVTAAGTLTARVGAES